VIQIRVAPTVSVKQTGDDQYVLVYLASSEDHLTADLSAFSLLNVSSVKHVSNNTVLTPVLAHVELMLNARLLITTLFVAVLRDIVEIHFSIVTRTH